MYNRAKAQLFEDLSRIECPLHQWTDDERNGVLSNYEDKFKLNESDKEKMRKYLYQEKGAWKFI